MVSQDLLVVCQLVSSCGILSLNHINSIILYVKFVPNFLSFTAPTGPPQNLTFMPMNSTSLFLTWAPPIKEHQNGFIQSYSVQFKESQSENKHLLNLTETQLTLSDLHPFYIYNFDIAAVTTVAPGPYMTKSFQMPEDGMLFIIANNTAKSDYQVFS